MGAPKSVVKISSGGVTYTDSVDRCNYYIFELTRAALRDVGRLVRKRYREAYYGKYDRHSGEGPKAISFKVYSSKNTKYPRCEIGIKHSDKSNFVKGWYTFFHERGTKYERADPLLKSVVEQNLDEIRRIEAAYLSGIENEDDSMIDEEEMDGDDDV